MTTSTPRRGGATASTPTNSTRGMTNLVLSPFLALAFVLLHTVYQVNLLIRQVSTAIQSATTGRPDRPVCSYTSLQDLVDTHECLSSTIRVPRHLAVVLADTAPSSIRLYLSTLCMRLRQVSPPATAREDMWQDFRSRYDAAVEAKHASDAAAMVHLARISGVRELSVYRRKEWSRETVQRLCMTLGGGYKTKAVFVQQEAGELKEQKGEEEKEWVQAESIWSKYAELRRRTTTTTTTTTTNAAERSTAKSSDSSSGGSPSWSDSEMGGPWSLDETLASSYTADSEAHQIPDAFDSSVDIRIGLYPRLTKPDLSPPPPPSGDTTSNMLVTLLSANDSEPRFTCIISTLIRRLTDTYCSQILRPDIDSYSSLSSSTTTTTTTTTKRRFSPSTLRKSWVSKRQQFASTLLNVDEVNRTLQEAGYMGEPELLVIYATKWSRVRMLYGFPSWPVRLSDLFYDESTLQQGATRGYGGEDFVKALSKFGKTEHRYGR